MQYITAELAPGEAAKIIKAYAKPGAARVTKAALRMALKVDPNSVQFVSTSSFHRPGSWLTLGEAVTVYGPVGLQVRLGQTEAMIEATAATVNVR